MMIRARTRPNGIRLCVAALLFGMGTSQDRGSLFGLRIVSSGTADQDVSVFVGAPLAGTTGAWHAIAARGMQLLYSGIPPVRPSEGVIRLGATLLAPGDLTGDGRPDLIASSFWGDRNRYPELVVAYPGNAPVALYTVLNTAAQSAKVDSLRACGDIDKDGCADFCYVGVPSQQVDARIFLISGKSGVSIGDWKIPNTSSTQGATQIDVATGDLDCDGSLDVVVSSPQQTPGIQSLGPDFGVSLLSVAKGTWRHDLRTPFEPGYSRLDLLVAGDLDVDGYIDLIAARQNLIQEPGHQRICAISGRNGNTLYDRQLAWYGPLGRLVLLQDIDGDSVCDIAIGCPTGGLAATGIVTLVSGKSGTELRQISDTAAPSRGGFGIDVTQVSDLDGKGSPDIAIGSAWHLVNRMDGSVRIVSAESGSELGRLDEPQFNESASR
jgi:hypothetical protein